MPLTCAGCSKTGADGVIDNTIGSFDWEDAEAPGAAEVVEPLTPNIAEPHEEQNLTPSGCCPPQLVQNIFIP
jgi:hypothetical protein